MSSEAERPRKATRFRLYAPFVLLAVLALGWTVAWFVIRARVVSGLDEWISAEAELGRRWSCADRRVAGYPFRIEIACASLTLERPDLTASLGRVLVVAQVYRPNHVIAEAASPLRVQAGPSGGEATWRLLQTSVVLDRGAPARVSIAADAPTLNATSPEANLDLSARRLELHLRRDAAASTNLDWALTATGAVVPGLDGLVGGTEPADIAIVLAASQAGDLPARPILAEFERWRAAGGKLDLTRVSLTKGPRRLEAKGSLALDELHRPAGQVEVAAIGLEGLLGRLAGERSVLGGRLLGALLGASPPSTIQQPAPSNPNAPALRPLPPLRLEGGRLFLGPLPIPGVRVPPLY